MSSDIYGATGVRRPQVSPEALQQLVVLWDDVRRAAIASSQDARRAIEDVLDANEGAAVDEFESSTTGEGSTLRQLDELARAALATRDAHRTAATTVLIARTTMDAVAVLAARAMLLGRELPFLQRPRYMQGVLSQARTTLTQLSLSGRERLTAIYDTVHVPDLLYLDYGQQHGNGPPELDREWAGLSTQDRIRLVEAVADDWLREWDDEDRPPIKFYSDDEDLPPGTERQTDPRWTAYEGIVSDGAVWLRYDAFVGPDSRTTPLHTIVHELQHFRQQQWVEQYDELVAADADLVGDIRSGRRPDPFQADGSTLNEVERMKSQKWDGDSYWHRPWEVDARRSALEYLDGMTSKKLQELLQH